MIVLQIHVKMEQLVAMVYIPTVAYVIPGTRAVIVK